MDERQSIQSTYDSQETGLRYHVTSTVDGRPAAFQQPTPDPFVRHTVTLGWRDLLCGLLHRRLTVTVTIGGDRAIVDDVLELDANALVPGPSTRREQFGRDLQQAMTDFLPEPNPEHN